jgi:hypothetical protein
MPAAAALENRLDRPHGVAGVAMALESIALATATEMGPQFVSQGRQGGQESPGSAIAVGMIDESLHLGPVQALDRTGSVRRCGQADAVAHLLDHLLGLVNPERLDGSTTRRKSFEHFIIQCVSGSSPYGQGRL